MATISITWDSVNSRPSADDITVHGKNSTVITWVPDRSINVTGITTPTFSTFEDFTAPASVGNSNNWQCTDNCDNDGEFTYTITGTHSSGGPEVGHDPKITNDREG